MRCNWGGGGDARGEPGTCRGAGAAPGRILTCFSCSQGEDFYQKSLKEWVVVGVSQVLLLALDWRKFLLYVWAPHFFAQWGIVSMNMLQHDGCDPEVDQDSSVEVKNYNGARNFVGPVINYLTFNNGYHTIHHMQPTLHWSRLAAEHERLVKPHVHPALDQQCMARYTFRYKA